MSESMSETAVEAATEAVGEAVGAEQAATQPNTHAGAENAPEAAHDGKDSEQGDDSDDQGDDEREPRSREARRYRTQLREVEAERDGLLERVETLQTAEVERLAGEQLAQPAGLWAAGVRVADLVDDTGRVDADAVAAAAHRAAVDLGLASPSRASFVEGANPQPRPTSRDAMLATVMGLDGDG